MCQGVICGVLVGFDGDSFTFTFDDYLLTRLCVCISFTFRACSKKGGLCSALFFGK